MPDVFIGCSSCAPSGVYSQGSVWVQTSVRVHNSSHPQAALRTRSYFQDSSPARAPQKQNIWHKSLRYEVQGLDIWIKLLWPHCVSLVLFITRQTLQTEVLWGNFILDGPICVFSLCKILIHVVQMVELDYRNSPRSWLCGSMVLADFRNLQWWPVGAMFLRSECKS